MSALELAIKVLATNLQIEQSELDEDTEILGNFPEFNSLTIVGVVGSIEEELDCIIEDEEISADLFESVATLAAFIESREE